MRDNFNLIVRWVDFTLIHSVQCTSLLPWKHIVEDVVILSLSVSLHIYIYICNLYAVVIRIFDSMSSHLLRSKYITLIELLRQFVHMRWAPCNFATPSYDFQIFTHMDHVLRNFRKSFVNIYVNMVTKDGESVFMIRFRLSAVMKCYQTSFRQRWNIDSDVKSKSHHFIK